MSIDEWTAVALLWPGDRLRRRRDQKAVERLIREISHTWTDEATHGD